VARTLWLIRPRRLRRGNRTGSSRRLWRVLRVAESGQRRRRARGQNGEQQGDAPRGASCGGFPPAARHAPGRSPYFANRGGLDEQPPGYMLSRCRQTCSSSVRREAERDLRRFVEHCDDRDPLGDRQRHLGLSRDQGSFERVGLVREVRPPQPGHEVEHAVVSDVESDETPGTISDGGSGFRRPRAAVPSGILVPRTESRSMQGAVEERSRRPSCSPAARAQNTFANWVGSPRPSPRAD
jgi:hypothetical protein